jgi:predicted N-acetyltransferase YhbS
VTQSGACGRDGPHPCPDADALARFLDRAFGGEPGIAAEFPTLTGPENRARSSAIEIEGRIAAHAAWRPLVLRSGSRRIAAAGIGLVATAPELRGRGLAGRVVAHCVEHALSEGAELAFMFGEHTPLYARLGFVRAGRERITRLEPEPLEPGARITAGYPADARRLLPLLARHVLGAERSAADFERVLSVRDTNLHVLEAAGGPLAYCVEGKGRDLRGVVHEWAGEPAHVAALLRGVAARAREPLWLLSPAALDPPLAGSHALGALALFRVLRPDRLGAEDARELLGDEHRPARLPIYLWGLDSI